jgi:hypothetical protein
MATTRQQVLITQPQAEALLAEWQRTLRLQDWDVVVRIVRGNGLELRQGLDGHCNWTLPNKTAFIRISDPVDYDPAIVFPYDMEEILVHELVHLHFAPIAKFDEGSAEDTALEQAVEMLSQALVTAKRAASDVTKVTNEARSEAVGGAKSPIPIESNGENAASD